jgi:succinoglycan biosynthesis protein ExoA
VVTDLVAIASARPDLEILLAVGSNPSRQRNLAVAQARGEILVFLDSDCRVDEAHFTRIAAHLAAGRDFVGGPVLLEAPAEPNEILFQSFFAHPAVTGPSSARYRVHGELRPCDDAGLILCNLAVRREIFRVSGGFDERLYPNEENEWMARLQAGGQVLWHDPALTVRRPQRKSWGEFSRTLIGYGRGRTRQSRVSRQGNLPRQIPAMGLVLFLLALLVRPWLTLKIGLLGWLSYAAVLRMAPRSYPPLSILGMLLAPTLPLFYAVGQIQGFFDGTKKRPSGEVRVFRWEGDDFLALDDMTSIS